MKICQWNSRSIKYKIDELKDLSKEFDMILLSETWLEGDDTLSLPGFQSILSNREDRGGGGVAILVRNRVPFTRVEKRLLPDTRIEICAIKTKLDNKETYIISAYKPPNVYLDQAAWITFITQINALGQFILGGDLNAHHEEWGCAGQNQQGRSLLTAVDHLNLMIVNNKSPTRIGRPGEAISAVDITITNPGIGLRLQWNTLDDARGSDHYPIKITSNASWEWTRRFSTRTSHSGRNWEKFSDQMENAADKILERAQDTSPTALCDTFVEEWHSAIEASGRTRHRRNENRTKDSTDPQHEARRDNAAAPWWDEECHRAIEARKEALKEYSKKGSRENYLRHKKQEAETKKILRERKKLNFQQFCGTLSRDSSATYVWNKIKAFRSRVAGNQTSKAAVVPPEILEEKIEELCPPSAMTEPPALDVENDINPEGVDFTREELQSVITGLKTKSAPGLDKVDYQSVKNLKHKALTSLLMIFNTLFKTGVTPASWNEVLVCLIPKPHSEKFRPISITSCLAKIMERLIKNRLEWMLENRNLLAESQMGFRKQKSCINNLSIITTDIRNAYARKQHLAAAFLDIKGAYDNVVPAVLIQDLINLEISPRIIKFICNLFTSRNNYFLNKGEIMGPYATGKGLLQGSVLSPILYSVYTRELENQINHGTSILQYADDIAIYLTDKDIPRACERLSQEIVRIKEWLTQRGLDLAPEKTQFVIFTRKKVSEGDFSLNIEDHRISNTATAKFLGMTLDQKLDWKAHISTLKAKTQTGIRVLKAIRGIWWGADPGTMLTIYKGIIRSQLDYGAHLLQPITASLAAEIDRIQYSALRLAMGYMNSTPTNAILAESREPPLNIRREELGARIYTKELANTRSILIERVNTLANLRTSQYWRNKPLPTLIKNHLQWKTKANIIRKEQKAACFVEPYEAQTCKVNVDLVLGKALQLSAQPNEDFDMEILQKYTDFSILYTDGSKGKYPPAAGCAVYCEDPLIERTIPQPHEASIFTAEARAILEAIKLAQDAQLEKIVVAADSKSALESISAPGISASTNPFILDIKRILWVRTQERKQTTLIWIPSHRGITGNEKADKLANLATTRPLPPMEKIPASDIKALITEDSWNKFNKFWELSSMEKGRHLFRISPYLNKKPWFHEITTRRKPITTLNRIRSGHCLSYTHLHRINVLDSANCSCGDPAGDLNHIFWECTDLEEARDELYKKLLLSGLLPPFNTPYLMTQIYKKTVVAASMAFLAKANIQL